MKKLLLFSCITLIVLACKKEAQKVDGPTPVVETPIDYCGVADPVNNLTWLRDKIESIESYCDSLTVQAVFYDSMPSEQGFFITYDFPDVPEDPFYDQYYFYRCDGTVVCSGGCFGQPCSSSMGIVKGAILYTNY